MEPSTLMITIGTGIIIVVIGLFIEYRYFQTKRDSNQPNGAASTANMSQKWIDTIHESAKSFCNNQGVKFHDIYSMKVANEKAHVVARAWAGSNLRVYEFVIDKGGDILEVKPYH